LSLAHSLIFRNFSQITKQKIWNMAVNGGAIQDTNGVNSDKRYSIPEETHKVFRDGILNNQLIASTLPKEIEQCAKTVRFEGTEKPSVPINWRFAESISALKGLEAAMVNVLLKRKYGLEPQDAVINT
jgi:hypothetical protein